MYVFISENCRKEAKTFGLETKIDKIARQIERLNYHDFTNYADKFEHPFYVKKQVAYNYRLLIKVVDLEIDGKHHQVAVFFKIFNRSNKGYDDFYYHVEKQGNMLYNQQNMDEKLYKYIQFATQKKDMTNTKVMDKADSDGYFFQVKSDILQLSALTTPKHYYAENAHWIYGTRPYLSDDEFHQVFRLIQTGIESGQSEQTKVLEKDVFFETKDNPKLSVLDRDFDNFSRFLPEECISDKEYWQHTQTLDLPIYLNQFQQKVINNLFKENVSFPYIVNAPSNHGKSSLSAILALHFLSQPNWQNHGVLPCLLLCSAKQKSQIKQQLYEYAKYYKKYINSSLMMNDDDLQILIDECCHDVLSYIENYADDELYDKFHHDKMIDFNVFADLWQSSSLFHKNQLNEYPVSLVWYVIYHLIKGKQLSVDDNYHDEHISHDDFMVIYQNIYKGWYELLQKDGYWDLQDLVSYANQNPNSPSYASLIIDDAHSYTDLDIDFLIKRCYWYHKDGLINQSPLLFFGSHHASDFAYDWHRSLTALLHGLLDDFNEKSILQPTVLDYQADFVSILQFLLYLERQKLNTQKFALGHEHTAMHDQKVYFIDVENKALLHALFGNKSIPIIINQSSKNAEQYLIDDEYVGQIFTYMKPSEGDIHFFGFDELSQKHQNIALMGFFDDKLSCFFDDDNAIDSMDLMIRQQTDELLRRISQTINQSISHIFIVGRDAEYDIWEKIFSHKDNYFIQKAKVADINPNYNLPFEKFSELDKDEIMMRAEWLFHHAHYEGCMKALLTIAHRNKDYEHYFEFSHGKGQKIFTLSYLWRMKNRHALLLFINYFKDSLPKDYLANCYIIQLLENELNIPKADAFSVIFNKYLQQYQDPAWAELWQILLDELIERLDEFEFTQKEYQVFCQQLERAVQKNTPHIYHYLAQCHYHVNHKKVAFNYWQQSKSRQELPKMPMAYYELVLEYGDDWRDELESHIYLDNLGAVMNALTTHDMNELQLSYWDNILPYLDDVQELEPVISYLLPSIHNPKILQRIYDYCKDEDIAGEFEHRLQRLLTLHACLRNDWRYVMERIYHYKPADQDAMEKLSQMYSIQKTTVTHPTKKGMVEVSSSGVLMPQFREPQNELVDIFYALNLSEKLITPSDDNSERSLSFKDDDIGQLFSAIKAVQATEFQGKTIWNVNFAAVRALILLMEKGANYQDRYDFYWSMTAGNSHHRDFALARFSLFYDDMMALADKMAGDETFDECLKNTQELYQRFKLTIDKLPSADKQRHIEPLKTTEEIVKSVLALTNKENKEIQRVKKQEQDYAKELKRREKEKLEKERIEKEQAEKAEKERLAKEKAEKERQEQERAEQERLEKERIAKQEAKRAEQERLEKEKQEKERLLREEAEKERIAQEQAEKERQEQERLQQETERLLVSEQEQDSAETTAPKARPTHERKAMQAVSSFEFFGWRIFVARLYGRVNVEDLATGERFSVQLHDMIIQSDWQYDQDGERFYLHQTPLIIEIVGNVVFISHVEHGVSLTVRV